MRHVMSESGAPWNRSSGGPEPPIKVLISAPDVLIRSLRKPSGKNFFHADWSSAWAESLLVTTAAAPAANTACCINWRRVFGSDMDWVSRRQLYSESSVFRRPVALKAKCFLRWRQRRLRFDPAH